MSTREEGFELVCAQLSLIKKHAPWARDQQVMRQIKVLKMDFRFLWLSLLCILTWDGEQIITRFGSSYTALRVLWDGIFDRLIKTWPVDVQAFHSLSFAMEGKIEQSKLQVEQWCEVLLSSSWMQQNFSKYFDVRPFLSRLRKFMDRFSSYRASKIVPFKNQIDILNDKLAYLDGFLENLESCTDNKKFLRGMDFASAYAIYAACLSCLYWAKEANEDTATAMNVFLFDVLHKLVPYAPDVIFLISQNLQASSGSIVLSRTVASYVDFLFDHLDNDFLILRDPLILLFTSLANPSHQNTSAAVEEKDLLHIQVNALFRDHSYLLLSFNEMKEVSSDKKTILSDFMAQIEIANVDIRQLYYGRFSDSCNILEAEKMDYIYFVSVSRELYLIEKHVQWADQEKSQLRLCGMELKFLRLFLLCFATCDDTNEEVRARMSYMITSLQGIWQNEEEEKGPIAARLRAIHKGDAAYWYPLALELEGKLQLSKQEMEAWCVNFLFDQSFQFKPSTCYKIMEFYDSCLNFLNDLVTYKADEIALFMKEIKTIEEKLIFLKNFLKLTANCCLDSKELREFRMFVQAFAYQCLPFLYWVKNTNGNITSMVNPTFSQILQKINPAMNFSEVNSLLSHMLQKINPAMPDIARLYFRALKAIYLQQCDSLLFGQTASIFADFFTENLVSSFKDDFEILHDEVIFLLTFLNDPPKRTSEELICNHISDLFWDDVYGFLPFDDTECGFIEKKMRLSDFVIKIGTVNAKIRQLYCEFPDLTSYSFPKIISPSFLDFIIQNLTNLKERMSSDRMYVPFVRHKIIKIVEELVSLRPFFNYVFELQNELKETWSEVVNLIHVTEHIICSCINSWFVFDNPIWHHMANLSDVIDRIKVVKIKLEKIKENTMYNARFLPRAASFINTLSEQVGPSKVDEIFVGFEEEAEEIIKKLTCQHMSLDNVSIVGMGGLGKTLLAKKVYGSFSVRCTFNVFAFCSVSEYYNTRRILHDILHDILGDDKIICNMTEDDLAHQLWKCLSRQKYLIVLDDIWDVSAWDEVKSSFPNHNNGSRVMFTTRSREVAEKCKISCTPFQLRFLSDVESWELLQKKVFQNGISPPYLYEIGSLIAKNCNGLPLAVVVIAGLLARTEISLRWWSEVAKNIASYLSDGGCMKILELSYKHLPEILKPCLLYLAAFPGDMQIRVKHVILLWIAEGFIQESETECLEDVAKNYFHNLVDRSLLIVTAKSSDGGIKTFRVHDLIYELCQKKCLDENFFQLNHGLSPSSSLDHSIIEHYRVSMRKLNDVTIASGLSLSNARSLLLFCERWELPLRELRLVQVLVNLILHEYHMKQLSSLVHLRHISAYFKIFNTTSIPQSICNIWNIQSLTLIAFGASIRLPEAFWRMKSLRHVKVEKCILEFPYGHEYEAYPKLDKVVCFSKPFLSSGKDVHCLLQRLPVVRKLSCCLKEYHGNDEESAEILDFGKELESLKVTQSGLKRQYLIHFPPTLKKLTLEYFVLLSTDISAFAELHCLQVLRLRCVIIQETILEMKDLAFNNLKFFELIDYNLVEWNASTESLPCLEQLVIDCPELEVLPPCFEEISALKKIVVLCTRQHPPKMESSVLGIQEEQLELGIEVEVSILKMPWCE